MAMVKRKVLSIDLETRSDVDIGKCGVYRYVEGDFSILLFSYAFDDEEVKIIDMAQGEKLPEEVLSAMENPEIIKSAWNAQFERTCIGHYLGHTLDPEQWQCSMVWAASLSLPLALKNAALVLKTGEQKDRAGEALIRKFSVPRIPTKTNPGKWNEPSDDMEGWQQFKDYCLQDVRTERDIRHTLERFPMPDAEWDAYHMDQRINDRGVLIDRDLVTEAIVLDMQLSEAMTNRAYELTGLENPNSVSQLKGWLEERGIDTPSLGKKEVAVLIKELEDSTDQEALDMMKLRLQMAKSSVKKYQAAERYMCSDNRARGLFQFNGANHTGRFSGRGIQLQNLYRNSIGTLDEARALVKAGDLESLQLLYGEVPDILAQLIRTMLIPKEGCEFIVADFSAIEARVLAWEAGEEWRLDAFKNGDDIYCASASAMFGVPVEKHGINGGLRQKGKVAELACIAEGELVLTDKGLVPIQAVTTDHLLWDGEEWVKHEGVILKGEREVVTYEGLTATADHPVWVEGKSGPIQFGVAAAIGAHLIQTGNGRHEIRLGRDNKSGEEMERKMECVLRAYKMHGMRVSPVDIIKQFTKRHIKGMPKLLPAKADSFMAGQETDGGETEMRKSKRSELQKLWGKRNKVRLSKCYGSRTFFDAGIRHSGQEDGNRQDRQRWGLCTGKSEICHQTGERCKQEDNCAVEVRSEVLALCGNCCEAQTITRFDEGADYSGCRESGIRKKEELERHSGKVKVYDIRNAGRRHRFTVSGKLVHNCGYQGGSGALISMGALDMGLKESELPDIIEQWRNASPHIVQYWWDLQDAAIKTVQDHKERRVQRVLFQYYSGTLWIVLPSGRKLAFLKPRIQPNRFGHMSLTFEGTGGTESGGKWGRQETYGGKICENITQAIARDLLVEAMLRLEKAGMDIVAHVHDEVIIESPMGRHTVEEVCRIMAENPSWCDAPLAAAGYRGFYYFKD